MSDPRLIICGAGGHGRVMLDVVRRQGRIDVLGFADDNPELVGKQVGGLPVLGALEDALAASDPTHFLVALGDNRLRAAKYAQFRERGLEPWSAIHPSAIIGENVSFGAGVQLIAGAIVNPEAALGDNVVLNTASSVDHHCRVGDHVWLGPGARLGGMVTLESLVYLGMQATVLPGLTIGEGAVVGAGAVVTHSVPTGVVVVGVPARIRRPVDV